MSSSTAALEEIKLKIRKIHDRLKKVDAAAKSQSPAEKGRAAISARKRKHIAAILEEATVNQCEEEGRLLQQTIDDIDADEQPGRRRKL